MQQFADHWTATKKLRRALLLIAVLFPLTGLGNCPPTKNADCQDNCEGGGGDGDGEGESGGGYGN